MGRQKLLKVARTGLAGSVQAQHQQAHLTRAEELAHDLGHASTHDGGVVGLYDLSR